MNKLSVLSVGIMAAALGWMGLAAQDKIPAAEIKTGQAAFFNAADASPGNSRKISVKDLPEPFATKSATNFPKMISRGNRIPKAPPGFIVQLVATDLVEPRQIRTAPNGDLFFMEKRSGELKVIRGVDSQGKAQRIEVFATGLDRPFGIAFYPAANPQWIYAGNAGSLVRFPYKSGDLKATGPSQKLADLPIKSAAGDYHDTRDLAISKDGSSIFVAVGSGSNIDDPDKVPEEKNRASVLEYKPDGAFVGVYASGIRNPVGLGVHPQTGEVWVSVNERDMLGDNLVPDYVTSVKKGGFYGWPYYYMGGNPDPRLNGAHPELKDKVIVPDVLVQAHSASLGFSWYSGTMFPAAYRGDMFVAEHGSWNRSQRSGAEVIRIPVDANGQANGVYQDFLTGFVDEGGAPWGRPVSTTVGSDGALYVTDDGSRSIWRVIYSR